MASFYDLPSQKQTTFGQCAHPISAMDFVTVGAAEVTVIVQKYHNFYTKNAQRKNMIFWCIGHGQTILITSNYI
jgi:hypothetical protein